MTEFRHLFCCPVYNLLFKNGDRGQTKVQPGLVPSLLQRPVADIMGIVKTQGEHAATLHYNTPLPSVTTQRFHISLPGPPCPNTSQACQHPIRQGGKHCQQGRKGGQLPSSFSPSMFCVWSRRAMHLRGDRDTAKPSNTMQRQEWPAQGFTEKVQDHIIHTA